MIHHQCPTERLMKSRCLNASLSLINPFSNYFSLATNDCIIGLSAARSESPQMYGKCSFLKTWPLLLAIQVFLIMDCLPSSHYHFLIVPELGHHSPAYCGHLTDHLASLSCGGDVPSKKAGMSFQTLPLYSYKNKKLYFL